jgi:hypothetical protein
MVLGGSWGGGRSLPPSLSPCLPPSRISPSTGACQHRLCNCKGREEGEGPVQPQSDAGHELQPRLTAGELSVVALPAITKIMVKLIVKLPKSTKTLS